jgi:ribosomal protein L37AE/L43A
MEHRTPCCNAEYKRVSDGVYVCSSCKKNVTSSLLSVLKKKWNIKTKSINRGIKKEPFSNQFE